MLNFLIILHSIMNDKTKIKNLPTLDFKVKVSDAKILFEQSDYDYILVLEGQTFKGLLFEEDIINQSDNQLLMDLQFLLKPIYLNEDYSIFDWFKINSLYKIDHIPVIDFQDFSYIDVVDYQDFIEKFKNTGLNIDLSSIIVLKKPTKEFKYSEVFQIAEAHNAKVFGSYINKSDLDYTEIILNINHIGLNELLQSYRRYGFDVISFHEEDLHQETLQNNSDYFSKYLTV